MEIVGFGPETSRGIEAYGSRGLTAKAVVRADELAVTVLRVAAGGEIGRHPAPVEQVMLVTAGSGEVCGGDGSWHRVVTGQAVWWAAGEEHTTRAVEDLTLVVLERPGLRAPA
ncbi:cupin domain-containing protein [Paractinoplanes lichenicola]|uniref:Cupin domain-containing protein n=1 Tax=Paractinoplanes lichenicola TaxID=2802976 RepID=A0ABS1VXY4_9ACTN|nr:cupin domain-containing protein [Actinoplanes lichenicola]MBL7259355.1 cupin domain-containing protein [Actinoplanes lichenicola]